MKYTTVYVGDNKIELYNSLLGKEVVKLNDKTVSTKYSITGTEHKFFNLENGGEIEYKLITGFGLNGVVIDLYRDKKPIIESPKSGCLSILLIIIVIGIIFGIIGSIN